MSILEENRTSQYYDAKCYRNVTKMIYNKEWIALGLNPLETLTFLAVN